jgi:hypothetical protein
MLEAENTVVDWRYEGKPDALVGTGATLAEKGLVYLGALVGLVVYLVLYLKGALEWTWWQYLLAAAIAADLGGGMVANSLNSCKRFYHSPLRDNEIGFTRLAKNHYFFSALHIYPLLVGLFFGNVDWLYGLFWYGALLLSTVVVLKAPLYLRRPLAMLLILLALLANYYLIEPASSFEWLVPALFLKIVYGHLVREEPYRPRAT